MATYFFPRDNTRARAVSLLPFATGILLPLWPNPESWYFDGSGLSTSGVYIAGGAYGIGNYGAGPYPAGPLGSTCGFGSACSDASGSAWMTQYTGSLVHLLSGSLNLTVYGLPASTPPFVGTAFCSGFGLPYTVNNAGNIYTIQGVSGTVFVGSYYGGTGAVYGTGAYGSGLYSSFALGVSSVWSMACSGTTLFSFAPGTLASFNLASSGAGSGQLYATPMQVPTCIAATGNFVALGGWSQSSIGSGGSGITELAFDTYNSNALAMRPAASRVELYLGGGETWLLTQSMSGITTPTNAAWDNDGVHAIVTDPVSGAVYGVNLALNTISIASTTTGVVSAGAVTIQPDLITGFVCQPSSNLLRQLNLIGINWTLGATFPLTGVSTVQTLAVASGVAAGYASGVAFLTGNGNVYTQVATVPLGYTPTSLALDLSGNLLAVGTSGSLGVFTPFTGFASGASINWTGNALDIVYCQGQVVVLDGISQLYRYFGQYTGVPYSQYNMQSYYTSGVSGIGLVISPLTQNASGGTVFTMTSGGNGLAYMSQFVGPFNLSPIASGCLGIFSSGVWTTPVIAETDYPTAVAFDASGNIQVATAKNNLYAFSTSGASLGASGIPVYTRQTQTTPLGISAMTLALGHMWGTSSLNGALVELF